MFRIRSNQAFVAEDVVLDGRLALFHQTQRWLAIADLHYGYEISQRASGRLVPMWGMATIKERLLQLLAEYRPRHCIILGDLVHDRAAGAEAGKLLELVGTHCELILLAGNHDRQLRAQFEFRDSWQSDGFHFHHGHCAAEIPDRVQIIGHHHPAETIADGAGLHLKFPAFVQQESCWILPAFSPWASGTRWRPNESCDVWICTPQRVVQVREAGALQES